MATVNLRPWREERRRARQQSLVRWLLVVAIATAVGAGLWYRLIDGQLAYQGERNGFLEQRLAELDARTAELESLRQQRQQLIERLAHIDSLQRNRTTLVHLFEAVALAVPASVHLTAISAQGDSLALEGQADWPPAVSELLRNLNASPWFSQAVLLNMEAMQEDDDIGGRRFSLSVRYGYPDQQAPL